MAVGRAVMLVAPKVFLTVDLWVVHLDEKTVE